MPLLGDATQSGYSALPQNVAMSGNAPNVADMKEDGRLEDFVSSLGRASGNPDAVLRTIGDGQNLRVLVPGSKSSVPSLWVRFLGAISRFPLLDRSATLRGARFEANSNLMDHQGVNALVSAVEREEKQLEGQHQVELKGHFSQEVRRQLEKETAPLTKRRVQEVLGTTVSTMGSYFGQMQYARTKAQAHGTEAPVPAAPPRMRLHQEPLTRPQQLEMEGTPVFTSPKDAIEPPRHAAAPNRSKHLMDLCMNAAREEHGASDPRQVEAKANSLYNEARGFLIRKQKWPLTDADDAAAALLFANRT